MQFLVLLNFAAALQGIFLTYLIIQNRPKNVKSLVLALLTFVLSVSLLGGIYGMSGYYKTFPHLVNVMDPLFLLYGPLLYIYIFVLAKNRMPKFFWLHGIPFVIYIISFLPLYLKSGAEKVEFAEYIFLNKEVPVEALFMQLGRVIYISVYVIVSLVLIKTHEKRIKDNFSDIEKITLAQAKRILYFFLAVMIVALVSFLLGYRLSFSFSVSNNIIGFFVGIIIYSLAYSTWKRQSIKTDVIVEEELPSGGINRSETKQKGRNVFVLNDKQLKEYGARLETAIQKEKVFIENELSLAELSKKINIQPYQLSELINRIYGESFFDFINRFRIDEIKSRLNDPASDSYSLLGVAMDCGFNSKSSFNTAFKKFTGQTPSEYRKQKPVSITI
ncbi:helix-turn-helix domain-containing protein [Maribellus comscasis]|uniref:Helix-turn-helix domain-containing protein n=1 Tax=Maribellus comscasis TaxID=2681766 RepID=A0A6I6K6R4_9BACT|nr:helix-turn-helix domain-containing protein [Maribellus comscasis]QGY45714.1 helix-turn-helix domain-containing protein [Maribellus comscasis]